MTKRKISSTQLLLIVMGYIQGSIVASPLIPQIAENKAWICIIIGFLISVPFILIITTLALKFNGMSLVQIHKEVYGRYIGGFVTVLYIYVFFILALSNISSIGDLYSTYLMPETPKNFFTIILAICISYTISKGIEVIARLSAISIVIVCFVIIFTCILLLPNMDFSNLMPFIDLKPIKYLEAINASASVFFLEIFLVISIIPDVENNKQIKGMVLLGMVGGLLSLLTIQIRNTTVEGTLEPIVLKSSIEVIRLIDTANIFTRMDMLIVVAQTVSIFFKCCILFYVLTISI